MELVRPWRVPTISEPLRFPNGRRTIFCHQIIIQNHAVAQRSSQVSIRRPHVGSPCGDLTKMQKWNPTIIASLSKGKCNLGIKSSRRSRYGLCLVRKETSLQKNIPIQLFAECNGSYVTITSGRKHILYIKQNSGNGSTFFNQTTYQRFFFY